MRPEHVAGARSPRAPRIALPPRVLAAGVAGRLRLVPDPGTRRRIRAALRARPSVRIGVHVTAVDAAGNRATRTRTVRVTG